MLPYQNLHQAEAALGRELTVAEKLWFNYSANKPDHLLHYHNILFLVLIYSTAPLPYMFIELSRSKKIEKHKIQSKVKNSFQDMLKCYKDVMRTFIVVVGPFQLFSYPLIKLTGIRTGLPLPSGGEMFWPLIVYFLIEDYTSYWVHRLLHSNWGYEKIHHLHHEYSAPMGFAAPYAHWSDILILGVPAFLGPALVPGHITNYWLWFVLRQVEAIEIHSGYDFSWSPTKFIPFYGGAGYHDYHHYVGRRSQSNFASVFTYCDYLYGTDKGYRSHKSIILRKMEETLERNGHHREGSYKLDSLVLSSMHGPVLDALHRLGNEEGEKRPSADRACFQSLVLLCFGLCDRALFSALCFVLFWAPDV